MAFQLNICQTYYTNIDYSAMKKIHNHKFNCSSICYGICVFAVEVMLILQIYSVELFGVEIEFQYFILQFVSQIVVHFYSTAISLDNLPIKIIMGVIPLCIQWQM